jgi:hypothetical protein
MKAYIFLDKEHNIPEWERTGNDNSQIAKEIISSS